jgi:hypothetical protein
MLGVVVPSVVTRHPGRRAGRLNEVDDGISKVSNVGCVDR